MTVTLEAGADATKQGLADRSVLPEVLLFYLTLANRAGRRWGQKMPDALSQQVKADPPLLAIDRSYATWQSDKDTKALPSRIFEGHARTMATADLQELLLESLWLA